MLSPFLPLQQGQMCHFVPDFCRVSLENETMQGPRSTWVFLAGSRPLATSYPSLEAGSYFTHLQPALLPAPPVLQSC